MHFIIVKNFGDIYLIGMLILNRRKKELKLFNHLLMKLQFSREVENHLILKGRKKGSIFWKKYRSATSKNSYFSKILKEGTTKKRKKKIKMKKKKSKWEKKQHKIFFLKIWLLLNHKDLK
jgi:hypothetical protein